MFGLCSLSVALQILINLGGVLGQLTQYAAGTHLLAVATGIISFIHSTLAYLAHVAAIKCLAPFCAASHAVNPFGLKHHLVHLAPFLRHFLSQTVIVVQSGYARLAFLAVEAATSKKLFHNSSYNY